MPVLTAVDLLGIQRYIFASNRLRDVVGSSELVNRACSDALLKSVGVSDDEIRVAAGGNVILRVAHLQRAKEIVSQLSRSLIRNYPGIEVVAAHHEYETGFGNALSKLMTSVARAKYERVPSLPVPGLAVTALCRETSLPANEFDFATRTPVSSGIALARRARADALKRWSDFLPPDRPLANHEIAYPPEIDDMGRTRGETSMIGVVHVDGNAVGRKLRDWLESVSQQSDDVVEDGLRAISASLSSLGRFAIERVLARVTSALQLNSAGRPSIVGSPRELSFELKSERSTVFLPIMPVLLGGDDLTFICDGRIALALAETALDAFRDAEPVPHLGTIGAAAGVAIVHAHAPFFRAYAMAEDLCRSAKQAVRDEAYGYAVDWEIGLGRPDETIEIARRSRAHRGDLHLTARPYRLDGDAPSTWGWLSRRVLHGFRGAPWSLRRNKVLALRSIASGGPHEVRRSLQSWRVLDPDLRFPGDIADEGFDDRSRTSLIDAVDLLDLHVELQPRSTA